MKITFLKGAFARPAQSTVKDLPTSNFFDQLGDPEKWPSVICQTEKDKLAGWGFIFGQYRLNAQSKEDLDLDPKSETDIFAFDVDDMNRNELKKALPIWKMYDCVLYSTFKHASDAPRLRLLCRLSEPLSNTKSEPFKTIYRAAAHLLNVRCDPQTIKLVNLFLAPQHKPGTEPKRARFNGAALDVTKLRALAPLQNTKTSTTLTARERPDTRELKTLAKKLKRGQAKRIGVILETVLRGEVFAVVGQRHDTTKDLAWELAKVYPHLDTEWFAAEHLKASWDIMWNGERSKADQDWRKAVETATRKLASTRAEQADARKSLRPAPATELSATELTAVRDLAGALIVSYRSAYYALDAKTLGYRGPYKAAEIASVVRDCLGAVPGVTELEYRGEAMPVLKNASKLTHEYGRAVSAVQYYAKRPPKPFDLEEDSIKIQAYKWITWDAVRHEIVAELLHTLFADKYRNCEAWLSKFTDLTQPLPALTLVGPRGTWKSRLTQTLSRFWYNRDMASPCRAEQVLRRFGDSLLNNPVIWSDEKLALSDTGKPMPERYRESISEKVQQIEPKGLKPVPLYSATRHVISVNEVEKVFSGEVDESSIEATLERFFVVNIDKNSVEKFENKWAGTTEMEELREGSVICEHVQWLSENTKHKSQGRLFVATNNDPLLITRARFSDDTVVTCIGICLEALANEISTSVPGDNPERTPLLCDSRGQLRINTHRIAALWNDSNLVVGSGLRKPTAPRIAQILSKAGFRADLKEEPRKNKWRAWSVNHATLQAFLDVDEKYAWDDLCGWCDKIFGELPI